MTRWAYGFFWGLGLGGLGWWAWAVVLLMTCWWLAGVAWRTVP